MTSLEPLEPHLPPECRDAHAAMTERLVADGRLDTTREAGLRAHLVACPECAEFERISRHLGELPPALSDLDSRRIIRGAGATYFKRRQRRRIVMGGIAVAAGIAAAALVALYPVGFGSDETPSSEGERLAAGERLRLLDGRVTLYSSRQTRLRTVLETRDTLHIRLDEGFLCANIAPDAVPRAHFRVITPSGTVEVKGTAFGVTVTEDSVTVAVVRGRVDVVPKDAGGAVFVDAGYAFDIGSRRFHMIDTAAEESIRGRLGLSPPEQETAADGAPEEESIRGRLGLSPPEQETAADGAPEGDAGVSSVAGPSSPTRAARRTLPSIKTLLGEAAQCRIDRDWACAAKRYRGIIATFPRRPEAATALVTLGQLQLDHLHRPAEARRNFERYLARRPAGALSEQALFGIARACRAVGDSRRERQALERFVSRHPSSPMAGAARRRLDDLKKN